ncbi:MAG TPA: hypothetical protein VFI04_03805 [Gaiellaceae bacterium]|nr:hypothetical protein [Gaiellaceae bacterium]
MEMPLPPPFQDRLLPTEPDAVDAATLDAIRAFCAAEPEIESAYVCSAERTREGEAPEPVLRLMVKPLRPIDRPGDSGGLSLQLIERFARANPELMRRLGGFGVLADRAVPATERYGLRIFPIE